MYVIIYKVLTLSPYKLPNFIEHTNNRANALL